MRGQRIPQPGGRLEKACIPPGRSLVWKGKVASQPAEEPAPEVYSGVGQLDDSCPQSPSRRQLPSKPQPRTAIHCDTVAQKKAHGGPHLFSDGRKHRGCIIHGCFPQCAYRGCFPQMHDRRRVRAGRVSSISFGQRAVTPCGQKLQDQDRSSCIDCGGRRRPRAAASGGPMALLCMSLVLEYGGRGYDSRGFRP